jgi:hypothetical protein
MRQRKTKIRSAPPSQLWFAWIPRFAANVRNCEDVWTVLSHPQCNPSFVVSCVFLYSIPQPERIGRAFEKARADRKQTLKDIKKLHKAAAALERLAGMRWKQPFGSELRELAAGHPNLAAANPDDFLKSAGELRRHVVLAEEMVGVLKKHADARRNYRAAYLIMLLCHLEALRSKNPSALAISLLDCAQGAFDGPAPKYQSTNSVEMTRSRYRMKFPAEYAKLQGLATRNAGQAPAEESLLWTDLDDASVSAIAESLWPRIESQTAALQ